MLVVWCSNKIKKSKAAVEEGMNGRLAARLVEDSSRYNNNNNNNNLFNQIKKKINKSFNC